VQQHVQRRQDKKVDPHTTSECNNLERVCHWCVALSLNRLNRKENTSNKRESTYQQRRRRAPPRVVHTAICRKHARAVHRQRARRGVVCLAGLSIQHTHTSLFGWFRVKRQHFLLAPVQCVARRKHIERPNAQYQRTQTQRTAPETRKNYTIY